MAKPKPVVDSIYVIASTEPKLCYRCGIIKPHTEFYKRRSRAKIKPRPTRGLRAECKACHSKQANDWNKANLDKRRSYKRERRRLFKIKGICLNCEASAVKENHAYCEVCYLKRVPEYRKYAGPCVICAFPYSDIHHLDGDRENNSKDNLISLCPNHHRMVHRGFISVNGKVWSKPKKPIPFISKWQQAQRMIDNGMKHTPKKRR